MSQMIWDSTDFSCGLYVLKSRLMNMPCDLLSISECSYKGGNTSIVVVKNMGSHLGDCLEFETTGVMNGEIYRWYVDRYKNLVAEAQYHEFKTRTTYRAWKQGISASKKELFKDKMESLCWYNGSIVSESTVAIGSAVLNGLCIRT